tara:strand:+ start:54 stop:608 length:555 start_codon:yes stop_codon:yes gene_type:complete
MSFAAALFQGVCSGHGTGSGSTHHPGLGGPILPGCVKPANDQNVIPKTVGLMNATTLWPALAQLPLSPIVRNVVINGIMPIVDQDVLTPHPTQTMHVIEYTGIPKGCPPGAVPNNAWHCTIGPGGREVLAGHSRKCFATCKTVFINGRRAGRFGDPLGDFSVAFPCTSTITGSSINVFIGTTRG